MSAVVNTPVVGAPKPTPSAADGSIPLRLEIRDLQKNADLWNLYLLGLQAFQALDQKSDLSYYGIAGIHGRPYRPWGGVKGNNPGGWQGYCTHTSILFCPWHRPYLALFEQQLFAIIKDIASKYPAESKARYQAAAAKFRIPYWDWAASPKDGSNFPKSVGSAANVNVITPTSGGNPVSIPNPLYTSKFHPVMPGDFVNQTAATGGTIPFTKWTSTLRYPNRPTSTSAVSDPSQVYAAMRTQFAAIQQNTNIVLTDPKYKNMMDFTNHELINSDPGYESSLEDIHNGIHSAVGGPGGHMGELDYSAFDPVFWLHHCNVDRVFALWQAINPGKYVFSNIDQQGGGTFVIRANTEQNLITPLAPFTNAQGLKFWNSRDVELTGTFQYAYPETQRWLYKTEQEYQISVKNTIQKLYGGLSRQFAAATIQTMAAPPMMNAMAIPAVSENQKPIAKAAPAPAPAPEAKAEHNPIKGLVHQVAEIFHHDKPAPDTTGSVVDSQARTIQPEEPASEPAPVTYTDYITVIKTAKHALHESYRVHIFLGEFTPDLHTWHTQDALVGTFISFGKNTTPGDEEETGCGKCKKDAARDVYITGTVPLTAQILTEVQKGNCPSMDLENVIPYLTKNLHWRVTLQDGTEYPRAEVPGLTIGVNTTEVTIPAHGRPERSGIYVQRPEVTEGRPAGASSA